MKVRLILIAALALPLAACGGAQPVRVETIQVAVPTPVACIKGALPEEPPAPVLTGKAQADTLLLEAARLELRTAFRVLHALAEPCVKGE